MSGFRRAGWHCPEPLSFCPDAIHPGPWAARYAPLSLLASLMLGVGPMACVMSQDAQLGSLAIMVTAGILGGIASRNAALPRLAIAQICLGAVPIGLGALLAPRGASWILVPPLFMYIAAMAAIVRRQSEEGGPLDLTLSDGRQLEMTRNPVPDGSAVIIIEDVTERRQSEAKMLYWARHDPLTGLPNRRYLRERLEIWASGAASSE